MRCKPRFDVTQPDRPGRPSSCFPADYDTSDLIEITSLGDTWAKYINRKTGETVDCAKWAAQMLEMP